MYVWGQQDGTAHLVLEVDGSVEVGNLGVDGLADNLALAGVYKLAHFCTAISTTGQDRTGQLERDTPSTVSGGPVDCWKPVRPPIGGQRWSAMAVGGGHTKATTSSSSTTTESAATASVATTSTE